MLQALFAEDKDTKLSAQISKRKLILKAVGDDPPTQMAQLLALEYLVGVTDPERLNQVSRLFWDFKPPFIIDLCLVAWVQVAYQMVCTALPQLTCLVLDKRTGASQDSTGIVLLTQHMSTLLQVSLALKALYDDDIVVEQLIIAWYDKPSAGKVLGVPAPAAKAVRQAAAKFVEWLQEAESDEESDESEDSLAEEE